MSSIVDDNSKLIENYILEKATGIHALANLYKEENFSAHHVHRMVGSQAISNIPSLMVAFDNGKAYRSSNSEGWDNYTNPTGYDPRTRPWWSEVRNQSGTVFTDIYQNPTTKELMFSIGESINNGLILGDIDLTVLNNVIKNINIPGSVSYITDHKNEILATTTSRLEIGRKLSSYGHLKELSDNAKLKNAKVQRYTNSKNIEKIAFIDEINVGDKKWHLFVSLDEEMTFSSLKELKKEGLITGLIIIIISIVLSILIINKLYSPVLALKKTIMGLSQGNGDLTQRLKIEKNDDLGQISSGINKFVESLQQMMLEIKEVSVHLNSKTLALSQQADSNTKILENHMVETEQISTAIEEMSSTANAVADNANATAVSTEKALKVSHTSMSTFNTAQESVSELTRNIEDVAASVQKMSQDTNNINSILQVIDEITEQTNLLALNAAIEAARAGEQGRGFAVVADEVRNLASRTKTSTSEIELALNQLQQGNSAMISTMDKTNQSSQEVLSHTSNVQSNLTSVDESVTQVNSLNIQIATAAEEQSTVTNQINNNVLKMKELVLQLSEIGAQSKDCSVQIATANEQLSTMVKKFKLD